MLPNFIIAGTNKSGTTSLFRHLANHSDVCASNVKETCYFLPLRYGGHISPISSYQSYFDHLSNEKLVIESTPGYFYGGKKLVKKVNDSLPGVRICLLFRDPVKRFFSFYYFMRSMQYLDQNMSVNEYLNKCLTLSEDDLRMEENNPYFGVEGGHYSLYLKPWIDTFGDRLQICFFENMVSDPSSFMRGICEFTDLDPDIFANLEFSNENLTRDFANNRLHAIALRTYQKNAKFLNSNNYIKKIVSSIYYRLNAKPLIKDGTTEAVLSKTLESLYQPTIRNLRLQLVSGEKLININGSFPAWLDR